MDTGDADRFLLLFEAALDDCRCDKTSGSPLRNSSGLDLSKVWSDFATERRAP